MRAAKGPRHGAVAHRWGGKGSRAGLVRPSAEKAARRAHGEESSRLSSATAQRTGKVGPGSSQSCRVVGQETIGTSDNMGNSEEILVYF